MKLANLRTGPCSSGHLCLLTNQRGDETFKNAYKLGFQACQFRQSRGQVCARFLSCPTMWAEAAATGWVLPPAWLPLPPRSLLLGAPARGWCSALDAASHFGPAAPEERHWGEPSLAGWPTRGALHAAEGSSCHPLHPVAMTTSLAHASPPVAMAMGLARASVSPTFPPLAPIATMMAPAHAAGGSSWPPLSPAATVQGRAHTGGRSRSSHPRAFPPTSR